MIAKRAEQNERQQQGFDGGSFADKQQINAGCKHDINDLHIEIEVQLQRLSQALVVDSLRQSSHLLRAERGGLELICLGFGRLMVLDLADPNALKGRFVPLAEDLLAEKVSRIIDLAERMQTRVDVLPRLFVGVVDGGVGVAGEFRRQIIIDVGVLGDGAVPAGRHVGLAQTHIEIERLRNALGKIGAGAHFVVLDHQRVGAECRRDQRSGNDGALPSFCLDDVHQQYDHKGDQINQVVVLDQRGKHQQRTRRIDPAVLTRLKILDKKQARPDRTAHADDVAVDKGAEQHRLQTACQQQNGDKLNAFAFEEQLGDACQRKVGGADAKNVDHLYPHGIGAEDAVDQLAERHKAQLEGVEVKIGIAVVERAVVELRVVLHGGVFAVCRVGGSFKEVVAVRSRYGAHGQHPHQSCKDHQRRHGDLHGSYVDLGKKVVITPQEEQERREQRRQQQIQHDHVALEEDLFVDVFLRINDACLKERHHRYVAERQKDEQQQHVDHDGFDHLTSVNGFDGFYAGVARRLFGVFDAACRFAGVILPVRFLAHGTPLRIHL